MTRLLRSCTRLVGFGCGLWLVTLLAACGGGGGGNTSSGNGNEPSAAAPAAPAPVSAAPPNSVTQSTTPNVQPIAVAANAAGTRNILQTSVTVCVPGTSACQTIDDIQVDTGSQGLRILASALTLPLAPVPAPNGSPSASCTVFGSGYTWGSVRSADIRLAGQLAGATSIQLIADPAIPVATSDCSESAPPMLNTTTLRGNGILGVGPFIADCGAACAATALPRWYYACAAGSCTESAMPLAQQVTNPVGRFATDNNGVLIELPAVPVAGSASVSGTLTFGIGSQANNLLGSATVLAGNPTTGYVTTEFAGASYASSFIDSGTNAIYFPATPSGVPVCGIWYCPSSTLTLPATIRSYSGAASAFSFDIASATTLFGSGNDALPNLAGQVSDFFAWGLPFFYGRRVFTALEGRPTPAGNGPYYAF